MSICRFLNMIDMDFSTSQKTGHQRGEANLLNSQRFKVSLWFQHAGFLDDVQFSCASSISQADPSCPFFIVFSCFFQYVWGWVWDFHFVVSTPNIWVDLCSWCQFLVQAPKGLEVMPKLAFEWSDFVTSWLSDSKVLRIQVLLWNIFQFLHEFFNNPMA